jgi:hypothetical protein
MNKCKICGKEFKKRVSLERHVTSSYGKEKKKKHCPILVYKWKYEKDNRFSKKNLIKMYVKEKKSTPMIKEELQVNKKTLLDTMHYYGIKMRSVSEASVNQIERDGLWNKGLTKYDHPSIMSYAKQREGMNNPYYTAPNFEERKKRNLEILKKAWKSFNNNRNPKSTEKRMAKILDQNNIYYIRNFSLSYYENGKTKWRLFDFLVEGKLLIEMNGNYFHANPKFYNKDDEIVIHKSSRKAKGIWEYDAKKMKLGKDSGYKTIVLWEADFIGMSDKEAFYKIENLI